MNALALVAQDEDLQRAIEKIEAKDKRKSPLYLTDNLSGGQLPRVLWSWLVGLLSKKKQKTKDKRKEAEDVAQYYNSISKQPRG